MRPRGHRFTNIFATHTLIHGLAGSFQAANRHPVPDVFRQGASNFPFGLVGYIWSNTYFPRRLAVLTASRRSRVRQESTWVLAFVAWQMAFQPSQTGMCIRMGAAAGAC